MYQWTEQLQKQAEVEVMRMASVDRTFRALALRDGRLAVERASGLPLPTGFVIRFVDPAGADRTVVLPPATFEDAELSEAELMAVAGGKGGRRRGAPVHERQESCRGETALVTSDG